MNSRSSGFQRRWVGYIAAALVFAVACVALSNWQFARRAQAVQEILLVQQNYDAPAVHISELIPDIHLFRSTNEWRTFHVTGHYLPGAARFVRNRVSQSEAGFDIAAPLLTTEGNVIVIDRGWVPSEADGSPPANAPQIPQGLVTVDAHARPSEASIAGQSDTEDTIASFNIQKYSKLWHYPTYTAAYGDLANEIPVGEHGVLATKPALTEGNHLSYALQWIAFALMGLFGVGWIIRREILLARNGNRPSQKPRTRKSRDEQEEDEQISAQL